MNAVMNGSVTVLDASTIRDISGELLDEHGVLRVMDASFYARTTWQERALFSSRHGTYVLPTHELIEYLRGVIAGRCVIEIGAGNGVVAAALGIRATDNFQQSRPSIVEAYLQAGQEPVRYGSNVENLDALSAVRKYRPQVILGCWVTHLYDPQSPSLGGNVDGIDERTLLSTCDQYVFVGSRKAHRLKPILRLSHRLETPPGLYSRASADHQDFVAIWDRTT